jgi:hypothetical protein
VIAAQSQTDERLISELADLTYHSLVLLGHKGLTPDDIRAELEKEPPPALRVAPRRVGRWMALQFNPDFTGLEG